MVGVLVGVGVSEGVGVLLGVRDRVAVGVTVGVREGMRVYVGVPVAACVSDGSSGVAMVGAGISPALVSPSRKFSEKPT